MHAYKLTFARARAHTHTHPHRDPTLVSPDTVTQVLVEPPAPVAACRPLAQDAGLPGARLTFAT